MNEAIAGKLREAADLLELQGANPFRVGAYRRAASAIDQLDTDVRTLVERDGVPGLVRIPHVGQGIAAAIAEMVATGRWARLDRLRGETDAVTRLQSVPGIGPKLAERIYETLHVDSLEALEVAAHDGRLRAVPGVGPRRAAALKATLAGILGRVRGAPAPATRVPSVALLLQVDREYRERAEAGELPTIAPKRFNPRNRRWLPIMHEQHGEWHFTALFSNTARAHELGRTRDWLVIYFYDGDHREGQCTVVTETRGPLRGQRVVRGREVECGARYEGGKSSPAQPPAQPRAHARAGPLG